MNKIKYPNNDKRTQGIRERRKDAKAGRAEKFVWNHHADTTGRTSGRAVQRIDEGVRKSGCYQWSNMQETDNRSWKNSSSLKKRKFTELIVCPCDITDKKKNI